MRDEVDIGTDELFSVDSGFFERHDFEELLEQVPDIAQLGEAGAKILPRFREFQHDGFSALFKGAPRVKRVEEISDQVTAHNKILEAMQGMEEWKTLRASTVRDRLASLVSIRELNDLVSKLPDGVKRAVHQQQNEERTAEELAARLEALRRMWKRTDDPNEKKEIEQEGKELAEKADAAYAVANAASTEMETQMEDNESGVRVAARDALKSAEEKVSAMKEALGAFGSGCGNSPGMPVEMPEMDALKLANEIASNAMLQRIARMAGRFQRISESSKDGMPKGAFGEIVDVETGNDLTRLTGGEMASFAHPVLKQQLYLRLLDHKALLWEKQDDAPEGLGPIVLAQDGSASTGGNVFEWESAIALTLRQEAARRKKPFVWIHYSTGVEVKKFDGEGQELECAQWATRYAGGGTDYNAALDAATKAFGDEDMTKADFVFLSDGQFPIDSIQAEVETFRKLLEEKGAKALGIYVGPSGAIADEIFGPLCDACWKLDPRFADSDEEIDILAEVFAIVTSPLS